MDTSFLSQRKHDCHDASVILLPLCPVSLMHKKRQRGKIIHCMHPVGCKDRLIDRAEDVFVEYLVRVISVTVLVAVV